MNKLMISGVLATILVMGFVGHSEADSVTLKGATADHVRALESYAKQLTDLCQYAETKFEKKYCYDNLSGVKDDSWYYLLTKQTQKKVDSIYDSIAPDFKKVKKS